MVDVPMLSAISSADSIDYLPIQNQDLPTLFSKLPLTHPRGDRDIIEQTESHGLVTLGMMPRRSNHRDGIFDFPRRNSQTRLNGSSSGQNRRRKRQLIEVQRITLMFQRYQIVVLHIYIVNQPTQPTKGNQ